jgi:hypothetical protein
MVSWSYYVIYDNKFRYSSIICIVTFKICSHTKHLSKIFILSVIFLSLSLYIAYMWLTNYYFTNNIQGTTKVAW